MTNPWLSTEPAVFEKQVRLVMTTRRPFCEAARQLKAGQALRLLREPQNPHDSQAVLVTTLDGTAVGYLDADTAAYMAVLLDTTRGIADDSVVEKVILQAPDHDPGARRLRYPRVFVRLRIRLRQRWPMVVIAAMLGVKSGCFKERFSLDLNSWLDPLLTLSKRYQVIGHDLFTMPREIVEAWAILTRLRGDGR